MTVRQVTQDVFDATLHSALAKVAAMPDGARVLHWIIYDGEVGRLEEPSFSLDAATAAMLEGRRAVGRTLLNELRKIDDKFNSNFSTAVREARLEPLPLTKEK